MTDHPSRLPSGSDSTTATLIPTIGVVLIPWEWSNVQPVLINLKTAVNPFQFGLCISNEP